MCALYHAIWHENALRDDGLLREKRCIHLLSHHEGDRSASKLRSQHTAR
jgi:hypothetical protein